MFVTRTLLLIALVATAVITAGIAFAGNDNPGVSVRTTRTTEVAAAATKRMHGAEVAMARLAAVKWLSGRLYAYQKATWYWQSVMGRPDSRTYGRQLQSMGVPDLERAVHMWQRQASLAFNQAHNPPHLADWMCIHTAIKDGRWSTTLDYVGGGYHVSGNGEGSWTDGGWPYYGGLQFGYNEWLTYGYPYTHKRYANLATPLQQIWAGVRYWRVSGFWPWPKTARACGLIP